MKNRFGSTSSIHGLKKQSKISSLSHVPNPFLSHFCMPFLKYFMNILGSICFHFPKFGVILCSLGLFCSVHFSLYNAFCGYHHFRSDLLFSNCILFKYNIFNLSSTGRNLNCSKTTLL